MRIRQNCQVREKRQDGLVFLRWSQSGPACQEQTRNTTRNQIRKPGLIRTRHNRRLSFTFGKHSFRCLECKTRRAVGYCRQCEGQRCLTVNTRKALQGVADVTDASDVTACKGPDRSYLPLRELILVVSPGEAVFSQLPQIPIDVF